MARIFAELRGQFAPDYPASAKTYQINNLLKVGKIVEAEDRYGQIVALRERFPSVSSACIQAHAASTFFDFFIYKDQDEKTKYYYGQISALVEKFPDPGNDLVLVKTAAKLVLDFMDKNEDNQVEQYYKQITMLRQKFTTWHIVNEELGLANELFRHYGISEEKGMDYDHYYLKQIQELDKLRNSL